MKRARAPGRPNMRGKNGNQSKEPIKVFCRVRPLRKFNDLSCLTMISPTIVQLSPPESTFGFRAGSGKGMQYIFKQVFDEETSQKFVFDTVALPLVDNLLQGKNGLLFTYGVTGSGKTYTMTGTPEESGVMPRCLDVIFNSIGDRLAMKFLFKPDRLNGFELQSEADAMADRQNELLHHLTTTKGSRSKLTKKDSDPDLAGRFVDNTCLSINHESTYAVFVTYIEIYNNSVYDLLEDTGEDLQRPRPLQVKIVREDATKNMYVHGVTELEVRSTEEAFEIFCKGQKRKRMAHTCLNTESSRSHSAFTIRLVQTLDEGSDQDDVSKKTVAIAQLSLVDLAGSERTNRTKNTGQRLREAGNINNSLMTLRTCLELLRENQTTGANKMIPYRESRLTHLFKNYFEGEGQVSMIVCVNPHVDDYDETIHVLKFAEMSQEVQVTCPTPFRINLYAPGAAPERKTRNQGHKHRLDLDSEEAESDASAPKRTRRVTLRVFNDVPKHELSDPDDDELIPNLTAYLDANLLQITEFIESIDSKHEELSRQLNKTEKDSGVAVVESQALKALFEREKMKVENLEAKLTSTETQANIMRRKMEDCEAHVKKLKTELNSKEYLLSRKKLEGDKVKEHYSNKIAQAQEKMKSEMEKKLRSQKTALELEVRNKENKLKEVKRILSDEYLQTPTGVVSAVASRFNTPAHSQTPSVTSYSARRPAGIPVANRRHRRSRSAGDVWLEHKPAASVPLNTVMQPQMKKRKSVSKLTDIRDITEGTDKYCLMTQNQDSEGDLETRLYKGDVIPTSGGGAQVMFNDVEVLKQISPNVTPPRSGRATRAHDSKPTKEFTPIGLEFKRRI